MSPLPSQQIKQTEKKSRLKVPSPLKLGMIRLDLKYSTLDFFFKKENKLLPDQVELDANSADSQRF
jgi:hypothetical protein